MKVKELIDYLKKFDQDKEIGIEDDGEYINIECYLDECDAYVLSGSYSNPMEFFIDGKWKDFK